MGRFSRSAAGVAVFAALALLPGTRLPGMSFAGGRLAPAVSQSDGSADRPAAVRVNDSTLEYLIRASVFILGDMGTVGNLKLERSLEKDDSELIKTFRVSGRTKPELVRKGRDIGGEFTTVTRVPLSEAEELGASPAEADLAAETYYTGLLEKNGVAKGEKVVFFPDYAVSTKTDGTEKKIGGRFQSLLTGFEFFLDNPVRPGEIYESKFILDGYPYLFKCEAGAPEFLKDYGVHAYRIDVTTFDGILKDGRGRPQVVKKKGGIRLWLSKEEPYKNVIVKMKLQYKWYLGLFFDLKSTA